MQLRLPAPEYILGLDLGQQQDYTALAILKRSWQPHPVQAGVLQAHYTCGHLQRWPLRTAYTAIADDLRTLVQKPPLFRPRLAVDQTGVGRAVVELFRRIQLNAALTPVLITSGNEIAFTDGAWHTPKKELVSTLQVLLQERRLQVAAVPDREVLVQELLNFKVKVTASANETFEAWRERDHDDLCLALAIAVWLAERGGGLDCPPFALDQGCAAVLAGTRRYPGLPRTFG
jgi:hypothetical protein